MPCLITPAGVIADAAMMVGLNWHSGIGVAHGWERASGPFIVTEANGLKVKVLIGALQSMFIVKRLPL